MFENVELNWTPIWMREGVNWINEYWRCGEVVKINLFYKKDKYIHYTAYIDYADFDLVKNYSLSAHHDKKKPDYMVYIQVAPFTEGTRRLHRLLMQPPRNMVVDHINRNPLDNRRINLRICSVEENNRNLSLRKNNTSGVMGVYYRKDRDNWVAQKYYKGKWTIKSGFKTKEEAAAYRKYLDEILKD